MEKFVIADNCAIRVEDTLKGDKCAVLLHGYLESLNVWDDFTGRIQRHVRVLAPDLPGHGISKVKGPVHTMEFLADTVHGLLTLSGIKKCTLVGHSMGGYVSLAFASKYPEMIDGLVLFHSTPNPDPEYAALEKEILEKINSSGVGPQGLGGDTTSFAVHIDHHPCHIASLPVAVNLNCHAARHASFEL